jgi:hypothetical protein
MTPHGEIRVYHSGADEDSNLLRRCVNSNVEQLNDVSKNRSAFIFGVQQLKVCLPNDGAHITTHFNPLAPNDPYMGRTAQQTSRRCILNTYSTNIRTEYFKRAA